jgi:hypothetical protein
MSTHDSTVTADISGPARELGVMDSLFRKPTGGFWRLAQQ